jgi:hypothetical protein
MNFKKVNNLTGWAVFAIAFFTYFLTREARGSLWDCGEFVACAYHIQLPHPPGAPVFVLLGRFFIILFGDDPMTAANAVNLMSAIASAFTILFLFWTITHFARKMYVKVGEEMNGDQLFSVMGAGIVGALAFNFSDSFWFSAVEGEVYALSSFFTALVFWAMLKWEHADEKAGNDATARAAADRWIVFIFFMMGLSIGVHLLNLLTIPAIVMIYYYRRYQTTNKGAFIAFVVGCLVTGLVQVGVIQYSMKAAGIFDVLFVNTLGMPFFVGFAIYFIAVAALIYWVLKFNEKNISQGKLMVWFALFLALSLLPFAIGKGSAGIQIFKLLLVGGVGVLAGYFLKPAALKIIKLSLWCYAFMILGYFMYFTAIIRSNANPSIDMNNVDNPINLVYYLSREQYGEAPLVYGPHFAAQRTDDDGDNYYDYVEKEMKYVKGKKKYIPIGRDKEFKYRSGDMQLFPRVWDPSNDQQHAEFYADWLGLEKYPNDPYQPYQAPGYGDNMKWFFEYQNGFMYWRYFMWNFAGKQNDVQGMGNKRDGNWISGISFIDNRRLGDQDKLPDSIKKNKAHNTLFFIPFLLGIFGCVVQFLRNRKDWIVNFLLFIITGVGVVIYLNQPGNQPRERDYAYVTSFYAFAVWIGLAVVGFLKMVKEKDDKSFFQNILVYGSILTFLVTLMSCPPTAFGEAFITSLIVTALYAALVFVISYLLKAISSGGQNSKLINIGSFIICVIAPLLMANQEWDDHDRSQKTLAPDLAKDYLESCAQNAILFTFGDNDTYPLWYAQEVEGVRKDIRIINNSLLGIDWYINQLRYKVNNADSIDVIWTPEQIEGHNREYMFFDPNSMKGASQETYYPLYDAMKNVLGKTNLDAETGRDVGVRAFPVRKFSVPVDVDLVKRNGTVNASDSVLPELRLEIPESKTRTGLMRNDFIILNIIAANNWKRPIYFTAPIGELGFNQYLRKDGLAYRLVPVMNKYPQANWTAETKMREVSQKYRVGLGTQIRDINTDSIGKNLLEKYGFGNADKTGVYFDEENRRHLLNIREIYAEAAGNLADAGKKEEAQKIIDKLEKGISTSNLPYAMVSRFSNHNQTGLETLEAYYKAGKMDLAEKVRKDLKKDMEQQRTYYEYIRTEKPEAMGLLEIESQINSAYLEVLEAIVMRYAPNTLQPNIKEGPTTITVPGADTAKKDSIKK